MNDKRKLWTDAYTVWSRSMAELWPVSPAAFNHVCSTADGRCAVEYSDGEPIGMVVYRFRGQQGQIVCLVVNEEYRRRGVGTKLLGAAQKQFDAANVMEVQLGSGVNRYFWPGVPRMPASMAFWQKHGWHAYEESHDMILKLQDYGYHGKRLPQPQPVGVSLQLVDGQLTPAVEAFAAEHFPEWQLFYANALTAGSDSTVLCAIQAGKIVGVTLIECNNFLWPSLFAAPVGSIGAVGVAEDHRQQGIGLALTAEAAALLKRAGCQYAFLGWTWLVDWYGKLGCRVWKTYDMLKRPR